MATNRRRDDDLPPMEVAPERTTRGPVRRASRGAKVPADATVTAIVKVHEPGYVPSGVKVRSRIDEYLFTASGPAATIDALPSDPNVASVSVAERLRRI